MTNHVLDKEMTGTVTIRAPRVRRRHLIELGAASAAAAAILFFAVIVTSGSGETTAPVQADAARWEALVAREYPGATAAAVAEADRWTALAAAYGDYSVLTPSRLAEGARWEAMADSYARAQEAESARLNGLAQHYFALPSALQAVADRYQGVADSIK